MKHYTNLIVEIIKKLDLECKIISMIYTETIKFKCAGYDFHVCIENNYILMDLHRLSFHFYFEPFYIVDDQDLQEKFIKNLYLSSIEYDIDVFKNV